MDSKDRATLPDDIKQVVPSASALNTNKGYITVDYSFINEDECVKQIAKKEDRTL